MNALRGAVALALVLFASLSVPADEKTVPNELPRSWNMDEIAKAATCDKTDLVYVLAWTEWADEDDLSRRGKSCLVLQARKNGPYILSHLYLRGKNGWQLAMTHAGGYRKNGKKFVGMWFDHAHGFESRPNNKQVYAALSFEGANWSFVQKPGVTIVSCGVCEKSWEQAIGEKPTKFFTHCSPGATKGVPIP